MKVRRQAVSEAQANSISLWETGKILAVGVEEPGKAC